MKTKKENKKLELNKKTVSNLENNQMNGVRGGCASRPNLSCGGPKTFTCGKSCRCH